MQICGSVQELWIVTLRILASPQNENVTKKKILFVSEEKERWMLSDEKGNHSKGVRPVGIFWLCLEDMSTAISGQQKWSVSDIAIFSLQHDSSSVWVHQKEGSLSEEIVWTGPFAFCSLHCCQAYAREVAINETTCLWCAYAAFLLESKRRAVTTFTVVTSQLRWKQ